MVYNVSYANQIDVKEAVKIAYNFFGKKVKSDSYDNINITKFYGQNGTYLYGIDVKGDGWVIVPSDDRLRSVLAYSERGILPKWGDMPLPMQDIIVEYLSQTNHIRECSLSNDSLTTFLPKLQTSLSTISIIVPNLLKHKGKNIRWNQRSNATGNTMGCTKIYNKFCPAFYNTYTPCPNHAFAGCTAVAMGQVLFYWQWPYYAKVPENMLDTLGNTSGKTMHRYDWSIVTPYIDENTDMKSVNTIADLLRDCGYASKMQYKKGGSGAYLYDAADALKNDFGYKNTLHHEYRPDSSDVSEQIMWLFKIKNDLLNNRPVMYAGYRGTPSHLISGHTYVLTGYNSADFFCVNWGYGSNDET